MTKLQRCNSIIAGRFLFPIISSIVLLIFIVLLHVVQRRCYAIDDCRNIEATTNSALITDKKSMKTSDLLLMRQLFVSQAEERRRWLSTNVTFLVLYNVLVPEVLCPYLVRVGSVLDGGKWVCNPFRQPRMPCSIYSFGISDEPSFDEQIQRLTNSTCNLYAYDKKQQTNATIARLKNVNGKFRVATIAAISNASRDEVSIVDLLRINGDQKIEMMKMDIEGDEFVVLPAVLAEIEICQIFIEMHNYAIEMIRLLRTFSTSGYYLFFYEMNGYASTACEFSFIHESCMANYGVDVILGRYLQ